MAGYTSVPGTGNVQEPTGDAVRFNGEGGVRQAWWWSEGPVDSCCCCCSLRTGVGILAAIDLLVDGFWRMFYAPGFLQNIMNISVEQADDAYKQSCQGATIETQHCKDLAQSASDLKELASIFGHEPWIFYLQSAVCMIGGAIGLWAVFGGNALAAKVYLYTWPLRLFLYFVSLIVTNFILEEHGLKQQYSVFGIGAQVFLFTYFMKVAWSYHTRLRRNPDGTLYHPSENTETVASLV